MKHRHHRQQPTPRGVRRDQDRLVSLAGKDDVRHLRTAGLDRELLAAFPDFTGRELALMEAFDGFPDRR
jgi:hypothetical protein